MSTPATTSTPLVNKFSAPATHRPEESSDADKQVINKTLGCINMMHRRARTAGDNPNSWQRLLKSMRVTSQQNAKTIEALNSLYFSLYPTYGVLEDAKCKLRKVTIDQDSKPNFNARRQAPALRCSEAFDGRHYAYMTRRTNTLLVTDLRKDRVVFKRSFAKDVMIHGLGFNEDNNIAIVSCTNLEIWSITTKTKRSQHKHQLPESPFNGYVVEYKNNRIFIGLRESEIVEIDLDDSSYTHFGRTERGPDVTALCFAESTLFAGDSHGNISVYDTTSRQATHILQDHTGPVNTLTVVGKCLVSGGEECRGVWDSVNLRDLESGQVKKLGKFGTGTGAVSCLTRNNAPFNRNPRVSFIVMGDDPFIGDLTFIPSRKEKTVQEKEA